MDVIKNSKKCASINCPTEPCYGLPETKKGIYCQEHAPFGYVNVISKKCASINCPTIPYYGLTGTKKGIYCQEHAPIGYVDVINKKCASINCPTRPSYGLSGYSPEYCSKHKKPKMVIYPLKHEKNEIILCEYCSHEIHYNENFCTSCKLYISLGNVTLKTHLKEMAIENLLKENFNPDIFNHDRVVIGGCSKRRPDFLITTTWGIIILEIDEFQHKRKNYPCECELSRMKELYFACGVNHLLFIRYNPDTYITVNGQNPGFLEGNPQTRSADKNKKREELLVKILKNMIEVREFDNLGVMYLYYDLFLIEEMEIEKIDPYK